MSKIILLFWLVIQLACAPAVRIARQSSTPLRPHWITELPDTGAKLFFVGLSSFSATLEEGQKAALQDALAKISHYIGTKVESIFYEYSTEIEHELSQQITATSSATVQGAVIEDIYYEKITRTENDFRLVKYDVYLLVSLDKAQAQKEIERQQREKQQKVLTAGDLFSKGLNSEKQGQYYEAQRFYRQALAILAEIGEIVGIEHQEVKNSQELQYAIKTQLQKVKAKLSQVALSIKVEGSQKAEQAFLSGFVSALNDNGFTITEQDPAIEITGEVFVKKSSWLMRNYVYYAQGSVSAFRTTDRQKIAVYPFQTKGFHRRKEQAALNALAESGAEAGKELAEMVLSKEKSKTE